MLVTGLNVLLISSLANFFFRSPLIFDVQLVLSPFALNSNCTVLVRGHTASAVF